MVFPCLLSLAIKHSISSASEYATSLQIDFVIASRVLPSSLHNMRRGRIMIPIGVL